MTNDGVPRLCGGTFFTQILQSRKPTVSQAAALNAAKTKGD